MLQIDTTGAITHARFDANIDYPALEALRETALAAEADETVRLLVLDCTGAADAWPEMGEWPQRLAHRQPAGSHGPAPLPEQDAVRAIRACMKPTMALLAGDVRGVALDLACACDIRLASASATVGDDRVRQGRAAATGIAYLLPKLIGLSQAMRVTLLGEVLDAAEAHRIGLVHEVAEDADFPARAEALAADIAALPTRAWAVRKLQVLPQLDMGFDAAMTHSLGVRQTHVIEDRAEGMRAWRERRPPAFTGR